MDLAYWDGDALPERDPWDDDDEDCWQVRLDHVKSERSPQVKFGKETAVVTWNQTQIDWLGIGALLLHCLKI